jgi:hypothetical protein
MRLDKAFLSPLECFSDDIPQQEEVMSRNASLRTLGAVLVAVVMVILLFAPGAWAQIKFKTLYEFTGVDGSWPEGGLIFDQAGNLYGTTLYGPDGNGVVFQLTQNPDGSWKENVLYTFGQDPSHAGQTFDQAGNLYGTTEYSVFKLTQNLDGSWTHTVLYSFCTLPKCRDGAFSLAPLIFDQAGNPGHHYLRFGV